MRLRAKVDKHVAKTGMKKKALEGTMKSFDLWDLIMAFGTEKEKDFFRGCADSVYWQVDCKVDGMCARIKTFIAERVNDSEK